MDFRTMVCCKIRVCLGGGMGSILIDRMKAYGAGCFHPGLDRGGIIMHRRIYMKAEVETVEKVTMEENDDYDKFEIVVLVRKDQEGEEKEIEEEEEKQEEKPVEKKPVRSSWLTMAVAAMAMLVVYCGRMGL